MALTRNGHSLFAGIQDFEVNGPKKRNFHNIVPNSNIVNE